MGDKRQKQAKLLRSFRKAHRTSGILLFGFFSIVAITGLLLGWKKDSAGLILPPTQKGTLVALEKWLPLHDLNVLADNALKEAAHESISTEISRIDIRKNKGILKFVYEWDHWEVQVDGATGKILSIAQRHADFIENLHDGSVIDDYLGTNGWFKLFYTTIMSLALLLFTITGFWLWYGPKRMRRQNRSN